MALVESSGDIALLDDFILYDRVIAIKDSETEIINLTLTKNVVLSSFIAGGDADATFYIKINGTENLKIRNSWTSRDIPVPLGNQNLSIGDNIQVTVINTGIVSGYFQARINGKEL